MIKLVSLNKKYKKQFTAMMDEWVSTKEVIIPYALTKIDYKYFDIFLNQIEIIESNRVKVPSKLFFCLNTESNKFIGAVVIRLALNNDLFERGGHISDGIVPSERGKGYGNKIVELAIQKCRSYEIDNILIVCEKTNIASSKTIINNNGILENEIKIGNTIIQRYWIN